MSHSQETRLLVLGDQTSDILSSLKEVVALAARSRLLFRFFQAVDDGIKAEIHTLCPPDQELFCNFATVARLVEACDGKEQLNVGAKTLLLTVLQLARTLLLLESDPSLLTNSTNVAVTGICTGSLAALAIACIGCIEELLHIAPTVARIALRLGVFVQTRADMIEKSKKSWALQICGVSEQQLKILINSHGEKDHVSRDRRLYISSRSENSITISGPPSALDSFILQNLGSEVKRSSLPLYAPFHASHLPGPPLSTLTDLSERLLKALKPIRHIVSTATGEKYKGTNLDEMLTEAIKDIIEHPLEWQKLAAGMGETISEEVVLIPIGPTDATKYFSKAFKNAGYKCTTQEADVYSSKIDDHQQAHSDIAIVGMSGRFPGADNIEELWKVFEDGLDLHKKVPEDRFDVNTHCDASGKLQNTTLTPYGVFMDNPGHFDARMFNMSPREAAQTDPMQRLLMLTTYEALEMSGYQLNRTPSTSSEGIGTYMGQTSDDYREVNASQKIDTFFITGGIRAFGPGRLNYYFKWEGPSYSMDTACSSSAASIQLACTALLAREVDTAVAGGANILTASDLFAGLSRGGFLSRTGSCKTFDDAADGYCRGDAVGVVVLKRLQDAINDNDNILSVIKSVATNHSANAISITHPHSETQQKLFRKVVTKSGLSPMDVDFVEMHGTGTQSGDFTEFSSVTGVFGGDQRPADRPLYLGTVKPNVGHGEAASGVTSLIKAVMMFQKNMIPPHIGIKGNINHRLPPLESVGVRLARGYSVDWPSQGDRPRRIVINNFDAAAGNTSMLIEEAPVKAPAEKPDPRSRHVVVVSGRTPYSLKQNRIQLLDHIQKVYPELPDLAYTTTARRQHHGYRSAYSAANLDELKQGLEKDVSSGAAPEKRLMGPAVFMFAGQGSHFSGMGQQLYHTNAYCRNLFLRYNAICVRQQLPSFLKLVVEKDYDMSLASPAELQLAIVATEMVLASLWQTWGIEPGFVMGHSLGEYPALAVAGVISVSDMFHLVGKRALLMGKLCTKGTHKMLAIQLAVDKIQRILSKSPHLACEIACINNPSSTVVSGPRGDIYELQQILNEDETKSTLLDLKFAFHSAQMDSLLDSYAKIVASVKFSAPKVPFVSSFKGSVVREAGVLDNDYLVNQCRKTVNFVKALHAIQSEVDDLEEGLWIGCGPQPLCLSMARATLGIKSESMAPTSKKNTDIWVTVSEALAVAYNKGANIKWNHFHKEYESSLRLLNLPSYAFELKNYWHQYEGKWTLTKNRVREAPENEKVPASTFKPTATMQKLEAEEFNNKEVTVTFASNLADSKLRAAVRGHLVNGAGLCPSSIYADMALTACQYIHDKTRANETCPAMDVANMEVSKPLIAAPEEGVDQWLRVTATLPSDSSTATVKYASTGSDGKITDHAHCIVTFGDSKKWLADWSRNAYLINGRLDKLVAGSEAGKTHKILRRMAYKLFSVLVAYGPKYQGMEKVYLDSDNREAFSCVKFQTAAEDENFTFSPYWIDSLLHLSGFVLNGSDATPDDIVYISHGWKSLQVAQPLTSTREYKSYVCMQPTSAKGVFAGDVYVLDGAEIVMVCYGLKFQQMKRDVLSRVLQPQIGGRTSQPRNIANSKAAPQQRPTEKKIAVEKKASAPETGASINGILQLVAQETEVDLADFVDGANFAELGVDSLIALGIVEKIREKLGDAVPSSVFIDYSTVGKFKAFLEKVTSSSSSTKHGLMTPPETPPESEASDDNYKELVDREPESSGDNTTEETKPSMAGILKSILATELGIDESEIHASTSFEELGVDSLMTTMVINEIKDQTGQSLPTTFFIDNATFGDVLKIESAKNKSTAAGEHNSQSKHREPEAKPEQTTAEPEKKNTEVANNAKATVTLLQGESNSKEIAVFLFPDGSGSASSYTALPSLSSLGPVYGLNSPFLTNPSSFTIESITSSFLNVMRKTRLHGPYLLAGWSIGGTYAYEAARQLLQAGEEVKGVILIDAPCPKVLPPMSLETIDLLEKIGIFDKVTNAAGIPLNLKKHFQSSINALKSYEPKSLPESDSAASVRCLAIWARHGVLESTPNSSIPDEFNSDATSDWLLQSRQHLDDMGWKKLLGNVKTESLDGNHFTIMRRPAIKQLGVIIAKAVTEMLN